MEFFGLHYAIWIVLVLYFVGMLALGWWSKREARGREGFLVGKRQFGIPWMIMHAFGAGTHPGDVAGVTSKTVSSGASGIWVSWMWMFGTPFYWLIAPIIRRMRCLTMADYFEERFGRAATILYVLIATVGMVICSASVLLATTRTVQGMMGKAALKTGEPAPVTTAAGVHIADPALRDDGTVADPAPAFASKWAVAGDGQGFLGLRFFGRPVIVPESDLWFFGTLIVTTLVFVIYSYWGGIIATIRTDFFHGLMIIILSFMAIPAAMRLPEIGGWGGVLGTLSGKGEAYVSLFDPKAFSLYTVLLLCINAPFAMLAQPHLVTVCGAGKGEWEGRVGFTYGNFLKRICTMGWCILAMCWLAYLFNKGLAVQPDAAFGDSVRTLLPPILQGVMLACVLAAGMSTGSAIQVTVAGLFSQNIYRRYFRTDGTDEHYVQVTKLAGLVITGSAMAVAIPMRESVVEAILDYFNLTAAVGIAVGLGILWRRMNQVGMFTSAITAAAVLLLTRVIVTWDEPTLLQNGALIIQDGVKVWTPDAALLPRMCRLGLLDWKGATLVCTRLTTIGLPLVTGILAGILGSLLSKPPRREIIEKFFKKIYVPIGEEHRLDLPFDEAVPHERRLCTLGGLFLVKPTTQSWVGFLIAVVIALAMLGLMVLLISLGGTGG